MDANTGLALCKPNFSPWFGHLKGLRFRKKQVNLVGMTSLICKMLRSLVERFLIQSPFKKKQKRRDFSFSHCLKLFAILFDMEDPVSSG